MRTALLAFACAYLLETAVAGAAPPPSAAPPRAPAPPPSAAPDPLAGLSFLVGDWVGKGGGAPGQGSGGFSLRPDLGGKVLVRRNTADYPAQGGRAAVHHEDLMVVFVDHGHPAAIYFDGEGHVIHYGIALSPGAVELLSQDPGPRYRLTYRSTGPDAASVKFEVAPSASPDAFKTYLDAGLERKK